MRRFAWFGLVMVPVLSAGAQTSASVIGGFVSAKMSASSGGITVTADSRSGFAAGVGITRDIGNDYQFAPEVLYVQKGLDQAAQGDEATIKLAYIEIPLLLRMRIATGTARPFIFGGPAVAIKASCATALTSGGATVTGDCTNTSSGQSGVKSLDYGVVLGAGITYRSFTASVRYDLGLANVAKDSNPGDSLKNRAWLFLVSLAIK